MATGVYVEGLRDITRAMERAGVEVEDLKDVMAAISGEAAQVMRTQIPVRSGRARDSIRPNRAKGKAVVTLGGARVPYVNTIRYGFAARNISPNDFIDRTDTAMETRAPQLLEEGWTKIAERNGLT